MAKLTEDMVTARARGADIATLRKLNCWGASLGDVSLLQQMRNLEVIAFSVNQIATLSDFVNCVRLKELYLRDNRITDMNQVCYLQELPALRQLWLKENPIERLPNYRETVLKALPYLDKLDDTAVTPSEVENARRVGRDLTHPLDPSAPCSPASSRSSSPQHDTQEYQQPGSPTNYYRDYEGTEQAVVDDEPQYEARRLSPPMKGEAAYERAPPPKDEFYDRDRGNSCYEPESSGYAGSRRTYDDPATSQASSTSTQSPVEPGDIEHMECVYPVEEDAAGDQNLGGRALPLALERSGSRLAIGSAANRLPRIPGSLIRSSNILSSVLLLIKELDVVSLEVVHVAVQSRINEMVDD